MSEAEGAGRGLWVDPRFHSMVVGWGANRTERRPGRRPRRVCPHGSGVTIVVNPKTGAHQNIECGAC